MGQVDEEGKEELVGLRLLPDREIQAPGERDERQAVPGREERRILGL
jgi:hypothetical protein